MAAKKQGKTGGRKGKPARPQVTRTRGVEVPDARDAATAKAVKQSSQLKLERIAHIEDLMASNRWRTGLTGLDLAAEWNVSLKTVEGYSAEASRRISSLFNPDERRKLKANWLASIDSAQRQCRELGDMSALRGMLDLEGRALGHFEPEKVQVSGNLGDLLQLGLAPSREEPPEEMG